MDTDIEKHRALTIDEFKAKFVGYNQKRSIERINQCIKDLNEILLERWERINKVSCMSGGITLNISTEEFKEVSDAFYKNGIHVEYWAPTKTLHFNLL